eukprot:6200052-Pleurochrysis_carterae.AAC.1
MQTTPWRRLVNQPARRGEQGERTGGERNEHAPSPASNAPVSTMAHADSGPNVNARGRDGYGRSRRLSDPNLLPAIAEAHHVAKSPTIEPHVVSISDLSAVPATSVDTARMPRTASELSFSMAFDSCAG